MGRCPPGISGWAGIPSDSGPRHDRAGPDLLQGTSVRRCLRARTWPDQGSGAHEMRRHQAEPDHGPGAA
eukprot:122848-Alexandrium_andersonii.AAC.1